MAYLNPKKKVVYMWDVMCSASLIRPWAMGRNNKMFPSVEADQPTTGQPAGRPATSRPAGRPVNALMIAPTTYRSRNLHTHPCIRKVEVGVRVWDDFLFCRVWDDFTVDPLCNFGSGFWIPESYFLYRDFLYRGGGCITRITHITSF